MSTTCHIYICLLISSFKPSCSFTLRLAGTLYFAFYIIFSDFWCGYSLKHPAPDKVPSENPPPKVGPLFLIMFYLIIYVQRLWLQFPLSPAIATNGRTNKEHEVEVVMLVSKGNVPSNILPPSSPVSYFILYLCLSLLLVLIFFRVPCKSMMSQQLLLLLKRIPPKQPSGKPCKTLEFPRFGKDSEPVPYEPKVLSFLFFL